MWRWASMLPINGGGSYPLQVGGTPLVASERLRRQLGLPGLSLKDETRGPTGSNKDRATALCTVEALAKGATAIAAASSGNVACSLAAGAAAVGLDAFVFVPAATASRQKVDYMRAFGATVLLVDGSYEAAYELSESCCARLGWYSRNTATNPLAFLAKRTVAFEVWEQLGGRNPEVAVLPVGDGVTLAAYVDGCAELVRRGFADRLPRVIGVQATGAAPLAQAFASDQPWQPVEADTVADGIGIGSPFFGEQALAAVRATRGDFETVSDEEIVSAIQTLASTTGILVEPAGAAALAGLIRRQTLEAFADSCIMVLLTGTGLKDHRWYPASAGRTLRVAPSLQAVVDAVTRTPT